MKKYFNPKKDNWASICERPLFDNTQIKKIVNDVFDNVKVNGDKALIQLSLIHI